MDALTLLTAIWATGALNVTLETTELRRPPLNHLLGHRFCSHSQSRQQGIRANPSHAVVDQKAVGGNDAFDDSLTVMDRRATSQRRFTLSCLAQWKSNTSMRRNASSARWSIF